MFALQALDLEGLTSEFCHSEMARSGIIENRFHILYCRRLGPGKYGLDFTKAGCFRMIYLVINNHYPNVMDAHSALWERSKRDPEAQDLQGRIRMFQSERRIYLHEKFKDWHRENSTDEVAKGKVIARFGWTMNYLLAQLNHPDHPHIDMSWMYIRQVLEGLIEKYLVWAKKSVKSSIRKHKHAHVYSRVSLFFCLFFFFVLFIEFFSRKHAKKIDVFLFGLDRHANERTWKKSRGLRRREKWSYLYKRRLND